MIAAFLSVFLIFFLIGLTIAILYLLNLQNTIKAAAPENRMMKPGYVWLLIIPLFNIFYMFYVAKKISATIAAEYAAKGQIPDNPRPTYMVGMSMAVCNLLNFLIGMYTLPDVWEMYANMGDPEMMEMALQSSSNVNPLLSGLNSLLGLAGFILWIAYWIQTHGYKNKMKHLPDANVESQIFGSL